MSRRCFLLLVVLGCLGLRADVPTPWLKHRISRNWRTPINRPPLNHDELLDDTDYYPDGYLAEMARDGVNGLWVSAELDQLSGSEKRLAKLRTTARKAARHGIGIWLMFNDPIAVRADDPRVTAHPEMFGPGPKWDEGMRLWCPSEPKTLAYVRERTAVVFKAVPELAGIINIAHGEGMTTCLSNLNGCDVDYEEGIFCLRCATRAPWELMADVAAAYVAGMRAGNPKAELLSWAYQASAKTERRAWVTDLARHQPDGSTFVYNFESGCVKEQLGRRHVGGDYWLSVAGPGAPFASVAAAARDARAPLAAKIQVSTSHEMATLPYVPAPGLLYRKYRAMRAAGVTSVLQCWYFGNMPGVMNKAAGWLASVDFAKEDERTFLRRLAADDWGADAPTLERIWSAFTEAYEDYPLDNSMQYYGPFAAGVAWPLSVRPELKPLARTWIPTDAVSGDFIGECLKDFTLDEAETLTARMAARCETVRSDLDALAAKCAGNPARTRDIGVMKAFRNQILAAHDVFAFYKARRDGDRAAMVRLATDELKVTDEMIALSEADDRLGWHSEAEVRLYSPELLRARRTALEEIVRTGAAAPAGRAPDAFFGRETVGSNLVWTATMEGDDCVVRGTVRDVPGLVVSATDAFGTVCPQTRHVAVTNGAFTVRFGKFRPGRLLFLADTYPQRLYAEVLWPQGKPKVLNRLRLPWSHGPSFGTIGSELTERIAAKHRMDDNLSVLISDIHLQTNPNMAYSFTAREFPKRVREILAMRPLPRRVICFGDMTFNDGEPASYAFLREQLEPLKAAGIDVFLAMGNHDRRKNFLAVFPEAGKDQPVPGRIVYRIDLGHCDLILLDSLNGAEMAVGGELGKEQEAWLKREVAAAKRPLLLGAHHTQAELSVDGRSLYPFMRANGKVIGWINGHEHYWQKANLFWGEGANEDVIRTLMLPTGGAWGEIGLVTLRTYPDRAVAKLKMIDMVWHDALKSGEKRPKSFDAIVEDMDGEKIIFPFERPLLRAKKEMPAVK